MDNTLNIRKKDAIQYINDLAYILYDQQNIQFKTEPELSIKKASSRIGSNGCINKVNIGLEEIYNAKIGLLKNNRVKIDDTNFVTTILTMQHEYIHCHQHNELYKQHTLSKNDKQQLVQTIACIGSPSYYQDDKNINYYTNASEIQAEYYGIHETYEYLCETFPGISPEYHEKLLVNIINTEAAKPHYFVKSDKPFTSLEEINQTFEKVYNESFTKKRNFKISPNPENDEIKHYMKYNIPAMFAFEHAESPLDQDKCIAAIFLKLHPKWFDIYPVLKTMDLPYDTQITEKYYTAINEKRYTMAKNIAPPTDEPQDDDIFSY